MAAALPQFAKPLLDMNIEHGVMVRFERKATDNDVNTLRNLLPGLGLMYPRDNHVLVQTRDDAERDMLEKRLAKATDNGKPVTLEKWVRQGAHGHDNPVEFGSGTIDFGTTTPVKEPQVQTQPTTPAGGPNEDVEMVPDEVPTAYMKKTDEKFEQIDKDMGELKHKVNDLGDGMNRIETLLKDGAGKPAAPELRSRPGGATPMDMVQGGVAHVVYKVPGMTTWRASKVTITSVKDGGFKAMPWTETGIPMPEISIEGDPKHLMNEPTANDVALN